MLIKDMDKALDMCLTLKVRQNTEFFKATADLGLKLPIFVYDKEGEIWLSTYFPKNNKIQKLNMLLSKFNATERETSFVVDSPLSNEKEFLVISKLIEIPSLILNGSDLKDGFLNFYARFHSSEIKKVSSVLSKYAKDSRNIRLVRLGPSTGIMKIMSDINKEYSLSIVTFVTPLNREDIYVKEIPDSPNIIAEVKTSGAFRGDINAIVYCDLPVEGLPVIDAKSHLYQIELRTPFPFMVRNRANENHIMRTAYFGKMQSGKIEVTVFIPTDVLYEFYQVLYQVAEETENEVIVKYLIPYSEDIWDFI